MRKLSPKVLSIEQVQPMVLGMLLVRQACQPQELFLLQRFADELLYQALMQNQLEVHKFLLAVLKSNCLE